MRFRLSTLERLHGPATAARVATAGRRVGDFIEIDGPVYRGLTTPRRGLGDMVHAVAHPIAKAIDAVAGTDLQHCSKCAQRRAALNRIF